MYEESKRGSAVPFSSISKRDHDRAAFDAKHTSKRAKRFITGAVSGNSGKSAGKQGTK